MKILICHAGSSSLKSRLFEAEDELLLAEGVIATREDLTIMRETQQLVGSSISQPHGNEHARLPQ